MTSSRVLIIALLLSAALVCALALVVVGAVGNHRARQLGVTPPAETPTRVMPAPYPFPPARPVGRHHEETVCPVPADWMPVTGAARLRALEQTHLIHRDQHHEGHS